MKDSSDESDDNVPATHESVNGNTMEDPSNDNILETKGELAANKDVPATHGMELSLLPPPISLQEQTFSSRKEMERAFNNFAATQGYGIVCKLQKRNEVDTMYATSVIVEENQETGLGLLRIRGSVLHAANATIDPFDSLEKNTKHTETSKCKTPNTITIRPRIHQHIQFTFVFGQT
ncbi:hypothetical protein PsorP6_006731 [Peronosclerospora sorghi]|uniref:Uncharacterized protein n=1 Tax=Peronosclerospora sorghi TaxID=230839 RepID=A0ACC0W4Q3_9STRA|nr:hypothetical protein PsorP6_006731 [Peronosclerospora sorghi]